MRPLPLAALLLLVGSAVFVVWPGSGASRPLNSHEILVAQTATEMEARGAYIVPYYNGVIRLEKPPLPYWLVVSSHRLLEQGSGPRVTELQARAPSIVAAGLLLLVTFALGSVVFADQRIGLVAALLFATTWDFFVYSRSARPEVLYALFCTLQTLGFALAIRASGNGKSSLPGALLGWSAAALALLSKGPQLPLFFFAGTAIALACRRPRVSFTAVLHPFLGLAIVAAVLPYFVYLASQSDGATEFWAAQVVQGADVPLWLRPLRFYYPAAVIVGMVPWSLFLVLAIRDLHLRRHRGAMVLAASVLVAIVGLSFAGKLRHHYVLPTIPLCAVLVAAALVELANRFRRGEAESMLIKRLGVAQIALVVLGLCAAFWLSLASHPVTIEPRWHRALPLCFFALLLAVAAARAFGSQPSGAFALLALSVAFVWSAVARAGIDVSERWASAASFAAEISAEMPAGEPILLEKGMEESLVYYGERRVVWVNAADWMARHPRGHVPRFVCEGQCVGVDGRVIATQRDVPEDEAMKWIHPRRGQAGELGSQAAPAGPAKGP